MLELVFGIKVIISGDIKRSINKDRPTIIILNHRTRFDWLFLACFMARLGSLTHEKIILKTSLKHVPIFGKMTSNKPWYSIQCYTVKTLQYCMFLSLRAQAGHYYD